MSKKLRYLVVTVMLLVATQAYASQWQSLPSQPASGRGLEASFGYDDAGNEVVYACVESVSGTGQSTIFKSTDNGQTWDSVLSEPGLCAVKAVPNTYHRDTVYAAKRDSVIRRTTDCGATWTWLEKIPGNPRIDVIAVAPNDAGVVYAGEGRFPEDCSQGGPFRLFRTTDGGASWENRSPHPPPPLSSITDIVVQPAQPNWVIFTSRGSVTDRRVAFTSTDGGATWDDSLALVLPNASFMSLNSAFPSLVYAGDSSDLYSKIAVSTNYGIKWGQGPVQSQFTWYATSVVAPSTNPRVVYVSTPGQGVWKSTDLGSSWFPMNSGMSLTNMEWTRITASPSGSHLFAGENTAGFYKYDIANNAWSQIARWTPCDSLQRVVVGSVHQVVSMSTRGVVSSSANGGASWTSTDTAYREAALVSPHDQVVIHTLRSQQRTLIRTSTDFGQDWQTTYSPPLNTIVDGLGFVPSMPSVLYGVGQTPTPYDLVLKSTDNGASWTTPNTFTAYNRLSCLALHQTSTGDSLFIGSNDGKFVPGYDDGQYIYLGSPVTILQGSAVRAIAVKPNDASILYAGLSQGVYKSTNGGGTWTQPAQQFDVKDLVVDPQHPDNVWVAATVSGVDHIYASFDDAQSWAEMSDGLLAGVKTNGLFLKAGATPQDPCSLYVATSVGVYRRELSFLASRNPNATAPNSGRKIVREPNTQNFHIVYTSTDSIFYSYSGNGGQTWSAAEFIDRGFSPAVVLNPPQSMIGYVPWVAYVKNNSTVWRAIRLAPAVWNYAQVFAGSAATQVGGLALASASLSMLDPMAYVTYSVTDPGSPPQHRINFNTFSRIWISPPETVYNSGSADSKDPSIAVTPGDIIHVCWNRAQGARQTIAYCKKQTGTLWQGPFTVSTQTNPQSEPASHPSVEAYGERVYCVWRGPNSSGSFPGDIWQSWSNIQPTSWSFPNNVSVSSSQESDNPEMSTDFVTVWNEQQQTGSSNYDIWAKFASESNSRPIFTSPLPSALPHVTGYWANGIFHTNTIWTEQLAVSPPLYEVKFEDYHWPPPLDFVLTDPGTYYGASVGQPEPSPYCTARDTFVTYQNCSVDCGQDLLSYRLPYLNPRDNYLLRAVFYHEGRDTVSFELRADSASPMNRNSRPFIPETVWLAVPKEAYQRTARINCGIRKTRGDGVSIAGLKLFQVEVADHRGRGGDQSAEHLGLPRLLLLQNTPNPFRAATSIRYQLPSSGSVSIRVLDVTGRLVRELANEKQQVGEHVVKWDGRDSRGRVVPPGVYFYHLRTANGSDTRRAVLVR